MSITVAEASAQLEQAKRALLHAQQRAAIEACAVGDAVVSPFPIPKNSPHFAALNHTSWFSLSETTVPMVALYTDDNVVVFPRDIEKMLANQGTSLYPTPTWVQAAEECWDTAQRFYHDRNHNCVVDVPVFRYWKLARDSDDSDDDDDESEGGEESGS